MPLPRYGRTLDQRFFAKVYFTSECWIWIGGKRSGGYGQIRVGEKMESAHRVAYSMMVGPIPDGLTLDHLCRNRMCVRPDHLEAVSLVENIARGMAPPAINARKEFCIRGHLLTGDNIYTPPSGGRLCRICRRLRHRTPEANKRQREYRAANAERTRQYQRNYRARDREQSS